jgi:hypothetical protein
MIFGGGRLLRYIRRGGEGGGGGAQDLPVPERGYGFPARYTRFHLKCSQKIALRVMQILQADYGTLCASIYIYINPKRCF